MRIRDTPIKKIKMCIRDRNQTALNNKLKELLVLHGNQPFTPGRPMPGVTPNAQAPGSYTHLDTDIYLARQIVGLVSACLRWPVRIR